MSEVIVKLTSDRIKIKGGEYVQDLVRCKDCKWGEVVRNHSIGFCENQCGVRSAITESSYCSYGEVRDE